MKAKRKSARHFDDDFRLRVLKDYYESGSSYSKIARKYGLSSGNIIQWERRYRDKCVSLPDEISELEKQVFMARSLKASASASPKSEEARLREENARLRKALEYSELRNEALNEVLKIGREQYGIDLLKKAGAKQ